MNRRSGNNWSTPLFLYFKISDLSQDPKRS